MKPMFMFNKGKLMLSALLFITTFQLFSQAANTWATKADITGARGYGIGFSIGQKGYIGMGVGAGSTYLNDFWEYDPATNAWTQRANYPGSGRGGAAAFSIGTKGYVGTGANASTVYATFYEYNPATNAWTAKANFPGAARFFAVGFSVGALGYIGNGANFSGSSIYNNFYEYNPSTDAWSAIASYPGSGRMQNSAFGNATYGFVGLGANSTDDYTTFYRYDPAANTWTSRATFPGAGRWGGAAASLGEDKGYFCAGNNNTNTTLYDDFYEYDISSNTWAAKTDYPDGNNRNLVGFSIGAKVYFGTVQITFLKIFTNTLLLPLLPVPSLAVPFVQVEQ
ncbi:MAG: hypothetical protein IPH78_12245 [Bacteroidetes bacterium]|nr:hypothetical protein [Bacteroidota bacterium]